MKRKLLLKLTAHFLAVGLIFGTFGYIDKGIIAKADTDNSTNADTTASQFGYMTQEDGTIKIYGYYGDDENIVIPSEIDGKTVTTIGSDAFSNYYNNKKYKSITIPNTVTTLCDRAFENCEALTSISIPASVTSIGYNVFSCCINLNSIDVDSNNPNYTTDNHILYNKDKTKLISCPKAIEGQVSIPNTVTEIGGDAFDYCNKVTGVDIPNSVTSIGPGAFDSCSALTSIVIPDSVTSLGGSAFAECRNLKSVRLSDNITKIDGYMFCDCTSLTSIHLPKNSTNIKPFAFAGCASLTDIEIPNTVTNIDYLTFSYCTSLQSVVIPSSVVSIGYGAFEKNDGLTIYGEQNSEAQSYAQANNIAFKLISEYQPVKKISTVNVKYVDENGNDLVAPKTLTGNVGDQYKVESISIDGYKVKTTPTNQTGIFTESPLTVIYVYSEVIPALTITKTGTDLVSPQTTNTVINLITDATGGKGTLSYGFIVTKSGKTTFSKGYSSSNTVKWTPTEAGNYTVYYKVKDSLGTVITKSLSYVIKNSVIRVEQNATSISYAGSWSEVKGSTYSGGSYKSTYKTGATATFKFTGTGLNLYGTVNNNKGIAKVVIDGVEYSADYYNSTKIYKSKVLSVSGLANTTHTVVIKYTGTKNTKSTGTSIDVDAIEIINGKTI